MRTFIIRKARPDDCHTLHRYICDLADFEKLRHEVTCTPEKLQQDLFGSNARAFAMIAEADGEPAGFALGFYTYSTFQGKYGLYIEDVYVEPECRGMGIGKAFFEEICAKAEAEDCGRVQWSVLDWNTPAIEFYDSMNARPLNEWLGYRLEGAGITAIAHKNKQSDTSKKRA